MQKSAKLVVGSKIMQERSSIKEMMAANNPVFNQKIQKILQKSYDSIISLEIFQLRQTPTPNIFYYEAAKYSSDVRQDLEEYIVKELDHFYNNSDQSYAIAYIHDSFVDFLIFRKIMEKWPQHFFHRLRKVYIVGATVMVRVIESLSFGTFYRLLDELFLNLANIQDLKQSDQEALKELGEDPTTKTPKFKNSTKIIQNQIYGKCLDEYDLYSGKYPTIILRLIGRLLELQEQLKIEGIFRKSCDSEELQILEGEIVRKNWPYLAAYKDVLVVCGCLKKILNNLRTPLFNFEIYQSILIYDPAENPDEVFFIRQLLKYMEYVNFKVFVLLLVFLKDYIISEESSNKMSAYNLAVVFGPCFFRPKQYDLRDLMYSGKFSKVIANCLGKDEAIIDESERMLAAGILKSLKNHSLSL